ncbi:MULTISPECIES: Gfo/Idh/MocA family oxidoreductase [unclassified Sphingomonas]|uniref:Gfo/Idh/MocA family protein n=1 Tax=unclassified Sphingomonas TaxID=196159 RepID=UPI0024568440|nr:MULTISPECIES: Gfo/Idh/MocA family oxidoreductase [unclassified Sphingomonas]MDH4745862.1 Gfo/Idh/MocA family oxidoreductase [Sphingomonas sp. CBMAI 2297]
MDRRSILGIAGIAAMLPPEVLAQSQSSGNAPSENAAPIGPEPGVKHRIDFGVIGLDHAHIYSMTDAMIRGGGVLKAFHAADPRQVDMFRKRYGNAVKLARSEDEILGDKTIRLIAGAPIPDLRAPLGIRAMRAGKDYLGDKPAITSLGQLAEVRRTIAETRRKFAIMYSERLEVRAAVQAGELVRQGRIGKVIQTVNLAPHRVGSGRPDWFWDKARYGGILTDIGSHQADQFLFYTGSKTAHVVAAQTGNLNWPDKPGFEDFGDMMLSGDGGTGYVRVDWFTPDGLPTWGDGRLFILGTEGYIELRKYVDIAGRPGGNHLLICDRQGVQYMDCSKVHLPFGPQFIADVVERSSVAQDQDQALLAAELVLTAQKNATRPVSA